MNPFKSLWNSFFLSASDSIASPVVNEASEPSPEASSATRHYRTIWISDTHLGTRNCHADYLLDFLRSTESDYLYLVGDIVDGWQMTKSWYWPQTHNDVIQKILRKARKGTQVVLIPGNHDEFLRKFGKRDLAASP